LKAVLRRRFPQRRLLAVLGCAGVQAYGGSALGTEPCELEVVGPERAAWQSAGADLGRRLEHEELGQRCRSVRVKAANGRATLLFVASDGRRAERDLLAPAELVPSVQALSATTPVDPQAGEDGGNEQVPAATSARDERQPPKTRALPRTPSQPAEHDANPAPQRNPYETQAMFSASMGFRTGADDLISPALAVTAAVLLERWELGLLGRFEGKYVDNGGGNDTRPETSGVAIGVTAGRREVFGRFSLRGGTALLFADVREEQSPEDGRAEARLGCYAGGAWPEDSWLALRLDLGAEIVPYNIGRSETNAQGNASLPWWAFSVAVGPEFR
jgi:hypothetical protein